MGFIFPISYIVMSIAMGLSVGTSSTIARAIGEGHQLKVQRLATDGLGASLPHCHLLLPDRANKSEYHLLPDRGKGRNTHTHFRLHDPLVFGCGVARGSNGR